jgi:hypothetical protein
MRLKRIISGGQTGADYGGLLAARALEIPTGGHAPRGYWTEKGANKSLALLGLIESESSNYRVRTQANVDLSDGTVIFADRPSSPGTRMTIRMCKQTNKPFVLNPNRDQFLNWLSEYQVECLNVAGNRESKAPGIQKRTHDFLVDALTP